MNDQSGCNSRRALFWLLAAFSAAVQAAPYTESGDAGNTPATARAVPGGADVINGTVGAPGDVDIYALTFDSAATITFTAGTSPTIDDNLILINGAGNPLWGNDDSFDPSEITASRIVWTVEPGTYYLAYGANNMYAYNAEDIEVCGNDDGNCSFTTEVVAYVAPGANSEEVGSYVITLSTPTAGAPAASAGPESIPTLSGWGMMGLSGLLALGSLATLRRRRG